MEKKYGSYSIGLSIVLPFKDSQLGNKVLFFLKPWAKRSSGSNQENVDVLHSSLFSHFSIRRFYSHSFFLHAVYFFLTLHLHKYNRTYIWRWSRMKVRKLLFMFYSSPVPFHSLSYPLNSSLSIVSLNNHFIWKSGFLCKKTESKWKQAWKLCMWRARMLLREAL